MKSKQIVIEGGETQTFPCSPEEAQRVADDIRYWLRKGQVSFPPDFGLAARIIDSWVANRKDPMRVRNL